MKKNKYNSNVKKYQSPGGYLRQHLTLPKFALAILPLVISANVQAVDFNFGNQSEVSSTLDMTLGYSTSFRTTKSDTVEANEQQYLSPGLNYTGEARDPEAGDMLTNMARITAELGMEWRNFGLVASANYQYDNEVMKDDAAVDVLGARTESSNAAKDYAGNALSVLDAYAYGAFDLGDSPLEVRVGKQVINWGESMFFINGIATQSPMDFNKFTTPGADLKEGYIGNPAVFASIGLGEESSLEMYYQWGWNRTELPPMDTFFGSEALGRGGDEVNGFGIPARAADIEAKDDGQFGAAFLSILGEMEYGVYYSHYHETLPMLAYDLSDPGMQYTFDQFLPNFSVNPNPAGTLCAVGEYTLGGTASGVPIAGACNTAFGVSQVWAEDQDMFGVSLATTLGDWSIAAEASFRPDQALWGDAFGKAYVNMNAGDDFATNIERHDTIHAAINGIYLGGPVSWLGLDAQVVLAQVGVDTISGDTSNLAVSSVITRDPDQAYTYNSALDGTFATLSPDSESYGAAFEWIGTWNVGSTAINLDIFAQHDFSGNSHWWGNFAEGRTLFATTVSATLANGLEAAISYSGNSLDTSDYEDQDTLALSANYKF